MALFQLVTPDIAVDIGTNNTRVYVKDKGIVVNEPSVVVVRGDNSKNIIAVGDSAEELIGRSAGNVRIVHPLRDGVIVDYEMAQVMIHYFVSKAIGNRHFMRPRMVVTMPGEVSKVERRAVINAMERIGARQIFVVEQAFAAALVRLIARFELKAHVIARRQTTLVYLKGQSEITDMLSILGAQTARFAMEDAYIRKELRNNANRAVNCDSANVQRAVAASSRQAQAISRLLAARGEQSLPPALAQTARMRLAHPELSLEELGRMLDPPLGKSGVNHRLRRLEQMAQELDEAGG